MVKKNTIKFLNDNKIYFFSGCSDSVSDNFKNLWRKNKVFFNIDNHKLLEIGSLVDLFQKNFAKRLNVLHLKR